MNTSEQDDYEDAAAREDDAAREKENVLSELKTDINNFLYTRVPQKMTIEDFENLAVELCEKIRDLWEPLA